MDWTNGRTCHETDDVYETSGSSRPATNSAAQPVAQHGRPGRVAPPARRGAGQLASLDNMPIVTVEVVADADRLLEHSLPQSLADAVGRVLNSPPGQTWIRLRSLRRDEYAENEALVDSAELPVFVTVLERQPPAGAVLQAEVTALTHAIAHVIGRSATCVHVEYAPAAAGRVAFGGKMVQ